MNPPRVLLVLISFLMMKICGAQLCQGSLGDPIVNITFGSGSNPGQPLAAASTSYQFVSHDCPSDGFYTVRNRTDQCFTGWHTLTADHTGNGNGYFMLVNATEQPSAFYVDTVNLQCNNTTYEFAAWVVNMNRPFECNGNPNKPNLTFNIETVDGKVLQSGNSGDIGPQTGPEWRHYGFFFNTPTNTSKIVLRIINNAQGGCGNDLALDDITFRPCGPLLNAAIAGNGTSLSYCEGQALPQTLNCEVSAGYSNPHYQWQQRINNAASWTDIPGANSITLNTGFSGITPPGTYEYRLSVSQEENVGNSVCRVNSNVITINIDPLPKPSASNTGPVCSGSNVVLSASDGGKYAWAGPNGFTSTAQTISLDNAQASLTGKYFVEVTSPAGCKAIDSTGVIVHPTPVASVSPQEISICEGETTGLQASGGSSYVWSPAMHLSSFTDAAPLASPVDSTLYQVIVANDFLCADTGFVQVNVSKKARANAGPDKALLAGQMIQLQGNATGTNTSFSWSPSLYMDDATELQPHVHPEADITYTLEVVSNDGCGTASDSVKVRVFNDIYIPNAFSPNGDGKNDTWNIPVLQVYSNVEILVFNRWGAEVYHAKNNTAPWDGRYKGKDLPVGVYPYIIQVKDIGIKRTGWVMIVR
jgi:gliding motility-associated-like protein